MSRVLVTGGAGFIGSHLVDALVEEGHEVRILDNLDPQVHTEGKPGYLNPEAEFVQGDVRKRDDLRLALKGIEYVYHQAALVGVGQSMYRIEDYVDVNTRATATLLDLIVNEKIPLKKLMVASSMSIYGEGAYETADGKPYYPMLRDEEQMKQGIWEMLAQDGKTRVKPVPTPEEKPLQPTSVYAVSKKDQEELCLIVGRAYNIPTVALRYFNVYGPRQSLSNPYTGVCAIFSSRIKNDNPPIVNEDGHQSRDFVHVRDIVQANLLVMREERANYQAFNVGTGAPTTVLQIAETLAKLYGREVKPEIAARFRAGDIRHCVSDASKLRALGFKPTRNLEEGLKELVEWAEDVRAVDLVDRAEAELKEKGLTRG
ncbi:MAG: NAD-dependent epimerase/dehydratase family protein [Candidatus Omnitrophica bacterium]|nr:NAD-dependent epimerase/dehydratase family protein [Candidatus Omnitrophota bacterium]